MTADPTGSTAAAMANLDILLGVNRTGKYFLYEGTLELGNVKVRFESIRVMFGGITGRKKRNLREHCYLCY